MVSPRAIESWLTLLLACATLLAGCDMVLLRPSGYVAAQPSQLVIISTLLMLLIMTAALFIFSGVSVVVASRARSRVVTP